MDMALAHIVVVVWPNRYGHVQLIIYSLAPMRVCHRFLCCGTHQTIIQPWQSQQYTTCSLRTQPRAPPPGDRLVYIFEIRISIFFSFVLFFVSLSSVFVVVVDVDIVCASFHFRCRRHTNIMHSKMRHCETAPNIVIDETDQRWLRGTYRIDFQNFWFISLEFNCEIDIAMRFFSFQMLILPAHG